MSAVRSRSAARPTEAGHHTVQWYLEQISRGRIRIPSFQRALKWESNDVLDLLDSLYKGYPAGSFLFWKRSAEAERVSIGPLTIDAGEFSDALWVVDGQQRLTTLAATLLRTPEDIVRAESDDPFIAYFDPTTEKFVRHEGAPPSRLVPLGALYDSVDLSEWLIGSEFHSDRELSRTIFEAGRRLREYAFPFYVMDDEEDVLRQVFVRSNKSGKNLDWTDVHDALFARPGDPPRSLGAIADSLARMGMGRLAEGEILQMLLAVAGVDPTENLGQHTDAYTDIEEASDAALTTCRRVLDFLRRDCAIVHRRLLPYRLPLVVLARFFAHHNEPSDRSRELLCRWVWRGLRTGVHRDSRTVLRRSTAAIDEQDEEGSVQEMLRLVPREWSDTLDELDRFDARAAASRIRMLGMAHLGPRCLDGGEPIDVAALLCDQKERAFRHIFADKSGGAENRVIHPPLERLLQHLRERCNTSATNNDAVLHSHGISEEAAAALSGQDTESFLSIRSRTLATAAEKAARKYGRPGAPDGDRPTLSYITARAE